MVFEYKNSKGKTYYLNQKGKLYYFSSEQKPTGIDLPPGFIVVENSQTGLPMLKKK